MPCTNRTVTRISRFALLTGTILAACPVHAQDTARGLEEIVVTAQRREQSLQSVPIPVSALSREQLQNRQFTEGRELERYVPSLKLSYNITQPTNLSPSLRGSTQQDASLAVAESPFGIYVDDVYVGRMNGNNMRLADVERVEVLRGPQGTLYGRNTLAGAIKFISRQPGDETWLNAAAGYGNYDQYEASASAGGPLGDAVAGSLAIQYNGRNGFGTNLATGRNVGEEENWAGRAKLRYMGSDNFDATVSISYADSRNESAINVNGTISIPADRRFGSRDIRPTRGGYYDIFHPDRDYSGGGRSPITNQPRGDTEQLIGSVSLSYDFGGAVLKSVTGHVDTEDFFSSDFSGNGAILGAIDTNSSQWTEELQLQGAAFDDKLDYILGAFYLDEQSTQNVGWFFSFVGPTSNSFIDVSTESYSVFGQAEYAITSQFRLTGGLRWTRDEKDWQFDFRLLFAPVPPDRVVDELRFEAWTPKFGLDYQVDTSGIVDSLLLYTTAARGFKSGGFNGINIFDASVARSNYGPETNWTYELGVKSEFFGNRLRFNTNYFYNRIDDLTLNALVTVNGNPTFPVQNAGKATIQGLELEASAILVEDLNAFVTATFLDGAFRDLDPTSAPATARTTLGVVPETPQTADYSFTVGFDYSRDISLGSSDATLDFGMDFYRTDDYIIASNNDFRIDAYDRINGYVGIGIDGRWEARVTVKNLENNQSFITGSRGLGAFIALPPRTYMLNVNYRM
ncbi:MAG: TonB-dependent receptor [Rhodospirillaceae bacterium]|nr:TonB-dependent receptor [Rhodospirillaceae bacterium]